MTKLVLWMERATKEWPMGLSLIPVGLGFIVLLVATMLVKPTTSSKVVVGTRIDSRRPLRSGHGTVVLPAATI